VLDVVTGNLYTVNVTSQQVEGKHFVDDFAWAPDNRHLLAIGSFFPYANQSDDEQSRLYLVDFISGQSDDILPTYTFYASPSKGNLAWSPDGSKLLVRCPTAADERICFITVQKNGQ
jgi:Tol biopolymer transport system component